MQKFDPYAVDIALLLNGLGLEAEHRGDSWITRCPSGRHDDRHPSYAVKDTPGEPKHGLGYCFACHFGGTAADLVAHHLRVTMPGAYRWISENAMGAPVDVRTVVVNVLQPGRKRMDIPAGVTIAPMQEWPTVPARFALDRGIEPWQVDRWGLGYAITGPLAGRIFLPAWGPDGDLQNYTARTFLRSPLRYKSAHRDEGIVDGALFGEQCWPVDVASHSVIVLEGILNALAVERCCLVPVAAMFGSNVYLEHLTKLSRFGRVVVLTDPDLAGDRAAEKLCAAFARHKPVVRAELPRGVDANDLERREPAELRRVLRDAGAIP